MWEHKSLCFAVCRTKYFEHVAHKYICPFSTVSDLFCYFQHTAHIYKSILSRLMELNVSLNGIMNKHYKLCKHCVGTNNVDRQFMLTANDFVLFIGWILMMFSVSHMWIYTCGSGWCWRRLKNYSWNQRNISVVL